MARPSWDQYFLDIAVAVAQRSTCPVKKVGCVIYDPHTKAILGTGYNGSPRGEDHCPDHESGSPLCKAIHGEINAIINCARNGVKTEGAEMALTMTPCPICAPHIMNAGIERLVCGEMYRRPEGFLYFYERGFDISINGVDNNAINYLIEKEIIK